MPLYAYTAIDAKGASASGSVTAQGRAAALGEISRKGLIPVKVVEQHATAERKASRPPSTGRVSQAAAESFIRELSGLLAGGDHVLQIQRTVSPSAAARVLTALTKLAH